MFEYSSVRASSWDVDALVTQLNALAADGWRLVGLVNTGGDVAGIVERSSGAAAAPAAAAETEAIPPGAVAAAAAATTVDDVTPWAPTEVTVTELTGNEVIGTEAEVTAAEVIVADVVSDPSSAEVSLDSVPSAIAEPVAAAPAPVVEPVTQSPEPVAPIGAATAATPPSSSIPANWYPDPSGRYELRYWDGSQWTEHVAKGGQRFTDPPVA